MSRQWPSNHLHNDDNEPIPFHKAQQLAWNSIRRIVVMSAGSQSGKTSYGPWWLDREITNLGAGDYLAVTSTYDLFKLKMLPAMLAVFVNILDIGRYWVGDKVIEIRDPNTGKFWAKRSQDKMYARVILRSADSLGGLEASTAKAAWLDECGQDNFVLLAYKAVRRRVALNRGRILMTTTLYNIGWFTQMMVDPALLYGNTELLHDRGGQIDYTDCEKKDITLIQFDSTVNPVFSKEEFEEQRDLLTEEEFQMFYRGRKGSRAFLIYDKFNRDLHTCPRFVPADSWRRFLGIDFGAVNLAGVFYAEEPPKEKGAIKRLYAYREYFGGNKTIQDHTKALLSGELQELYSVGGSQSEQQWRREFAKYGLTIRAPDIKDVELGISRVYTQHAKSGIIYFDDLHMILDEKGRYCRKKNKDTGEPLDEIKNKKQFHLIDAERYIIGKIRPGRSLRAKILRIGE